MAIAATDAPPRPLTARQREIYTCIFEYTMTNGHQPTLQDIAHAMGDIRCNAVYNHLDAIRRKGWIDAAEHRNRAIRFLRRPDGKPFKGFVCRED